MVVVVVCEEEVYFFLGMSFRAMSKGGYFWDTDLSLFIVAYSPFLDVGIF